MNNDAVILFATKFSCKKVLFKSILEQQIDTYRHFGFKNIIIISNSDTAFHLIKNYDCVKHTVLTSSPILDLQDISGFLSYNNFDNYLIVPNPTPYISIVTLNRLCALKTLQNADCTALIPKRHKIYKYDNQNILFCNSSFISHVLQNDSVTSCSYIQKLLHLFKKEVVYFTTENSLEIFSPNDELSLYEKNEEYRKLIISKLVCSGVNFISTDGIVIDSLVTIGNNTTILPGSIIKGSTKIDKNCVIGPNSLISDCIVQESVEINSSQCYNSNIHDHVKIGPFCHIRPNSTILSGAKIGDFVEVKNSTIGEKTSISHLTYVGDSDVGKRVNFGCGVVTVNYDGTNKNRCIIGDDCFIGCNTNLVAPVNIGDGGYTAAGSTITCDVPADALAIARERQINKEGYAIGRVKKK